MRIALVGYAMVCGGMEMCMLRLGRYLHQRGCAVDLIMTAGRGDWFDEIARWDLHSMAMAGSWVLPQPVHARRVGRVLRNGGYDVVLLNQSKWAQAALGMLPDSVVALPILHNDHPDVYSVGCANSSAWQAVVAVGARVAAGARKYVTDRPVLEIVNGVDMPDAAQWERRAALTPDIRLVYVGRLLHAQKGVLLLPEILAGCRAHGLDATLTIVGDGPDRAELAQRFVNNNLQEYVIFSGILPPAQAYTALLDSHFLLMPSFFEGMPLTLLESQACGCVPVASRLPGITTQAVIEEQTGSLVTGGDAQAFVAAVLAIASEPSRWCQMSAAGHAMVEELFSTTAMGDKYWQLITAIREGNYPLPVSRTSLPDIDYRMFTWRDYLPCDGFHTRRLRQHLAAWWCHYRRHSG